MLKQDSVVVEALKVIDSFKEFGKENTTKDENNDFIITIENKFSPESIELINKSTSFGKVEVRENSVIFKSRKGSDYKYKLEGYLLRTRHDIINNSSPKVFVSEDVFNGIKGFLESDISFVNINTGEEVDNMYTLTNTDGEIRLLTKPYYDEDIVMASRVGFEPYGRVEIIEVCKEYRLLVYPTVLRSYEK